MAWLILFAAIILEVTGTTNMKLSHGLTKPIPSILVFVFYGLSLAGLALVLKRIDVSIAYAVWSGLGTALIAVVGLIVFNEPLGAIKVLSLALIIAGVVGLNLFGSAH